MPPSQRSTLFVEGEDDRHALGHLLGKRGLDRGEPWFPEIKPEGDWQRVLLAIGPALRTGTGRTMGFVLDADASPGTRWREIASELQKTDMQPPAASPTDGYIDICDRFQTRVGVWLMPDNRKRGAIEEFLLALIDPSDPLLGHAERATAEARNLGAALLDTALKKAELRTWLAWRERPGFPYGRALAADYFDSGRTAADPFVSWFERLFRASAG